MSNKFNFPFNPLDWQASPHDFAKAVADVPYMGTRTVETTQRYVLGTRKLFWDGRVYKYGLSNGACYTGQGAQCNQAPFIADDGNTEPDADTVAGDMSLTVASQTVAEDALAGGYFIAFTSAETKTTFRGIVGNTVGTGTTITIYLDEPLTQAMTANTTDIVAYYSPYYGLQTNVGNRVSTMGIAAEYASASGKYFWLQTWGPCRVAPGEAGYGDYDNERQMVFTDAGSLWSHNTFYATDPRQSQHAGFIIPKTASADDAPLVMLQISI